MSRWQTTQPLKVSRTCCERPRRSPPRPGPTYARASLHLLQRVAGSPADLAGGRPLDLLPDSIWDRQPQACDVHAASVTFSCHFLVALEPVGDRPRRQQPVIRSRRLPVRHPSRRMRLESPRPSASSALCGAPLEGVALPASYSRWPSRVGLSYNIEGCRPLSLLAHFAGARRILRAAPATPEGYRAARGRAGPTSHLLKSRALGNGRYDC